MDAARWVDNLAAWSAQAALLIAVAGGAAWMFRLRLPRMRLAYWQILLAACLLLPAVEPWRPVADGHIEFALGTVRTATPRHAPAPSLPWRQALLMVLAAGCAARALWLTAGFVRLRRWRRNSRPFPLAPYLDRWRAALAPAATFLLSASVSGPVTFGIRRPVVVLPTRFLDLAPDLQEAVACHELLHVRRRDWIFTVAEEAIRAALWFHPAVWWLISQVQLAREQTVDREVVARTARRTEYLNALLSLAERRASPDLAPAALFLRKRHLKNRVALLMKEITMSRSRLMSFCAASCGALLAAGWLAVYAFPLTAAPVPQQQGQSSLLHSVAPQYPQAAREKHIEGDVVLEVHIDADGHVSDAQAVSGPAELRGAALEAVLQWHYSPEAMNLPATTQVTLAFKLPKEGAAAATPAITPEPPPFTLKSIEVDGLTDPARDKLLQRLPVRVGDTVDADVMKSVSAAVRAFDDHLVVYAGRGKGTLEILLRSEQPPAETSKRIRVGGNVQQAKLRSRVMPVYPPEAKKAGIEGTVRLQATLDKEGKVAELQLLGGEPMLAGAAMDAVRQWQYETTLLNGDPVEVITEINVNFTLAK